MTDQTNTVDWERLACHAEQAAKHLTLLHSQLMLDALSLNAAGVEPTQDNIDSGLPSQARRFVAAYNATIATAIHVQRALDALRGYVNGSHDNAALAPNYEDTAAPGADVVDLRGVTHEGGARWLQRSED